MRVRTSKTVTCDGCVGEIATISADSLAFRRWARLTSGLGEEIHLCPDCAEFPREWVLEEVSVQCGVCGCRPVDDPSSRFQPWERAPDPQRGGAEIDLCPSCFEAVAAERPELDLPLAA